MAAITAVLFSRLKAGDTVVAQEAVYSATFTFLKEIAARWAYRLPGCGI
jgi:cystathionine beta-lyase/cystathionine gamma-synthase